MANYKFNQNKKCEYFPCHKGVDEDKFNCLFCYCPLFMLGDECGGNFSTTHGVKDCSGCTKPHDENSYDFVMSKMGEVMRRGSSFIKGNRFED
ncbi:metal-binding protein [Acidaminobacter sp. JC074]|uniref:cysteine-rich small domain-containing protein n=1 Tax=Acidaminobacter sp. JC074 TaxID=2530199 RepID=UPI001F0EDED7|nr:cysteine-rich small domain-containing protein [Acidaminobacter sp. JC074]MCH4888157.1 metal-binding protein [Acidaminobacter sp. JC074]